MEPYQYTHSQAIIHCASGKWLHAGNTSAWRKYLAWIEAGGTPDPADDIPPPVDHLIEMRDLLLAARAAFEAATDLAAAKVALLDLIDALLGRHADQTTTMEVRRKG